MTDLPTEAELDAIEQRANAATPGPWAAVNHSHPLPGCRCLSCDEPTVGWMLDTPAALDCGDIVAARTVHGERNENGDELGCCEVGPLLSWADVEFASHARQDVPALVAAVRKLRADIEISATARTVCHREHAALADAARDLLDALDSEDIVRTGEGPCGEAYDRLHGLLGGQEVAP